MDILWIILVAGGTFGLCYLLDKAFTKVFRGKKQHKTGLEVRLNKRYGAVGLIVGLLGIAALISNWLNPIMCACGILLILMGAALVVYYMTFGLFYDEDSFVLTTFGKKSNTYEYKDICCQQLYNSYGNIVIELQMTDGRAVQLHATMMGVYPFLDKAFSGWLRQQGKRQEDCTFYDPANSCWFPPAEG